MTRDQFIPCAAKVQNVCPIVGMLDLTEEKCPLEAAVVLRLHLVPMSFFFSNRSIIMGMFVSPTFNNLRDLFVNQLEDIYDAEKRLIDTLPKMADASYSDELKQAFLNHLNETRGHVNRLEDIFRSLGIEPKRETCAAMKGLIKEGSDMIDAEGDPSVKDAALIAAAQRVEHYEIAVYGTLRAFANHLGLPDLARTLQDTLEEEGNADKLLTEIAESGVNVHAEGHV